MSEWRSQGKQVLQDGRLFADAAGELEAMMIVNAMRALDGAQHRGGTVTPPERPPLVGEAGSEAVMPPSAAFCRPRRENDEYVCSKGCGVRWAVRENAPNCGKAHA